MDLVYQEMGPDEQDLDWRVTRSVMADATLMGTLQDAQSSGEKHAVIALVEESQLKEAYVSPEECREVSLSLQRGAAGI